jgi:hypothetical protein
LANGPDEADQFARDGGDHHVLGLAGRRQPAIAIVQPQLRLPGDPHDLQLDALLPALDLLTDARRLGVGPGALDEQSSGLRIPRLGDAAPADLRAAGVLGRHQAKVGHQLARCGEPREVADLSDDGGGCDHRDAAHRLQGDHQRRHRPGRDDRLDLLHQAIVARVAFLDRQDVLLHRDLLGGMLEFQPRQPAPV